MVSSYKGSGLKKFEVEIPKVNIEGLLDDYKGADFTISQISLPSSATNEIDLGIFINGEDIKANPDPTNTTNISDTKPVSETKKEKKWWEKGLDFAEDVGNFVLNAGCSVANTTISLYEGVAELVEGIVDAGVIILASAATIANPTTWVDLALVGASKLFDFEYESVTEKVWTDAVMPFVGFDISGKTFDALYSIPVISAMNEKSFGPFKRGGTVYNVGKSVGTVLGTVALAVATGGTSIPITASVASTSFAGMQKMGNSIEKNYKNLSAEEKQDIGSITKVNLNGTAQGVIEAGTWYLTYGNGLGKVGKAMDQKGLGAVFKKPGTTWAGFLTDKKKILKLTQQSWIKGGIQIGKTYSSWGIDLATIGSSKNFGEVTFDAFVNAGISMFYDNAKWELSRKFLDKKLDNITEKYTLSSDNSATQSHVKDMGNIRKVAPKDVNLDSLKEHLKITGGNENITHFGSMLYDATKKSGGTIIKKTETLILKEIYEKIRVFFK